MTQRRWLDVRVPRGIVASRDALAAASDVGARTGGIAQLDAPIAMAATIAVVYPHMNGVGGDRIDGQTRLRRFAVRCGWATSPPEPAMSVGPVYSP